MRDFESELDAFLDGELPFPDFLLSLPQHLPESAETRREILDRLEILCHRKVISPEEFAALSAVLQEREKNYDHIELIDPEAPTQLSQALHPAPTSSRTDDAVIDPEAPTQLSQALHPAPTSSRTGEAAIDPEAPTQVSQRSHATIFSPSEDAAVDPSVRRAGERHDPSYPSRSTLTRPSGTSKVTGSSYSIAKLADTPEEEVVQIDTGTTLNRRFELLRVLGKGGMGVVYEARDQRRVEAEDRHPNIAIKILNNEFRKHPKALIALQREARKANTLAHPNIVTVFDFDKAGGHAYVTMELLQGDPLDHYIKKRFPQGQPLENIKPIIKGIGDGLAYAHSRNIIHSDLKPSNIFLTEKGVSKIFDFGIARAAKLPGEMLKGEDGEETKFDAGDLGAITPAYASLEMLLGDNKPHPSDDIYALGCIVHELLTGRHPFVESNNPRKKIPATVAREKKLRLTRIKQLNSRQWKALRCALAFERKERYHDAQKFITDILEENNSTTKQKLAAGLLTTTLLAALLYTPVQSYLEQREIDRVRQEISDGSRDLQKTAIEQLLTNNPQYISNVLSLNEIEEAFLEFAQFRAHDLIGRERGSYHYPKAIDYLEVILRKSGRSNIVTVAVLESFRKAQEEAISELQTAYTERFNHINNFLEQSDTERSLDDPGTSPVEFLSSPSLITLYQQLRQAAPDDETFSLELSYIYEARLLEFQHDLEGAVALITEAVATLPNARELVNLQDQMSRQLAIQQLAARIAETSERIEDALPTLDSLRAIEQLADEIAALRQIEPASELLLQVDARLNPLLTDEIDDLLEARRFDSARDLVDGFNGVLHEEQMRHLQEEIATQQSQFSEQVATLFGELEEAVAARRLDGGERDAAMAILAQLRTLAPDHQRVEQGVSLIGQAFLDLAREQRAAEAWQQALTILDTALKLDLSAHQQQRLESERQEVARAEEMAQRQLAAEERERLEQQRRNQIAAMKEEIDTAIGRFQPQQESAQAILERLNDLATLAPTDPYLREGRERIARLYAEAAEGIAVTGQHAEALAIVAQGSREIPESRLLTELRTTLQTRQEAALAEQQASQVAQGREALTRLLTQPTLDEPWDRAFNEQLRQLRSLIGSEPAWFAEYRQAAARRYLQQAVALGEQQRFEAALSSLQQAHAYAPDLEEIAQQQERLRDARQVYEREIAAQAHQTRLAGLRQTLLAQVRANDVANAERTLAQLRDREMLGPEDPFVTTEAPQQLADAYSRLAEQAVGRSDHSAAMQLIQKGLGYQESHPKLIELQNSTKIEASVAELRGKLASAPPVTLARELDALRDQISRERYGELYNAIDQSLTRRIQSLAESDFPRAREQLEEAKGIFRDARALQQLTLTPPADPRLQQAEQAVAAARLEQAQRLVSELRSTEADPATLRTLERRIGEGKERAERQMREYEQALANKRLEQATARLDEAAKAWADNPALAAARRTLQEEIEKERGAFERAWSSYRQAAISSNWRTNRDWQSAKDQLAALEQGWPQAAELRGARAALEREIARWLESRPVSIVSDRPCTTQLAGHGAAAGNRGVCYDMLNSDIRAPLMVVVPSGGGLSSFAIGLTEVTIRDYNHYCTLSGSCTPRGGGNDLLPITRLSTQEVEQYIAWLNQRSPHRYRLPTEREWHHAAAGGSSSSIRGEANCRVVEGTAVVKGNNLVPVNIGDRNNWGLFQTLGNAAELARSGSSYLVLGGAHTDPVATCSIDLSRAPAALSSDVIGFRLLREL